MVIYPCDIHKVSRLLTGKKGQLRKEASSVAMMTNFGFGPVGVVSESSSLIGRLATLLIVSASKPVRRTSKNDMQITSICLSLFMVCVMITSSWGLWRSRLKGVTTWYILSIGYSYSVLLP